MKKLFCFATLSLVLLAVTVLSVSCSGSQPERFEETRSLMDTFVTVVVYSTEETSDEVINAAFDRMEEIETIATTWDSKGEAYRLNENGYLDDPSDELVELLELSIEYNELTGGSFDITVQPLLNLYQYDPEAETQFWDLEKDEQLLAIDAVMPFVGSDGILIEKGSVKLNEGMEITLGGIAKGYAADEALKTIRSLGVKSALINAGGDIRTIGSKPGGESWEIALVNPDDTTQILAAFRVIDKSVTTSGNYERYFNPDKTAHHILNPMTGFSANGCISVTIIAENGAQADALATGVFVFGPDKGMQLVESLDGVEAFIVDTDRGIHRSSGISKYMDKE